MTIHLKELFIKIHLTEEDSIYENEVGRRKLNCFRLKDGQMKIFQLSLDIMLLWMVDMLLQII